MSKVTITIEDEQLSGGTNLVVVVESDPPLPIARVSDQQWQSLIEADYDLDMDRADQAQVAARLALEQLVGSSKAAAVIVRSAEEHRRSQGG